MTRPLTTEELKAMMTDPNDQYSEPYGDVETYTHAANRVEDILLLHRGERFSLDDICRWAGAVKPQGRKWVSTYLGKLVDSGVLDKDKTTRIAIYEHVAEAPAAIDWLAAEDRDELEVKWPRARGEHDSTRFGFDESIAMRPNDLIVVAGVSNAGKSVFARNFLAENIDTWAERGIRLMVNEYSPGRFKSSIGKMPWVHWVWSDGTPRFELVERYDQWKHAVLPKGLTIIDWIAMDGEFWKIRDVLKGIREKLDGGVCMVVLQKSQDKTLGEGGIFSEQLASVYLNIDKGRLTVRKIKEPKYGANLDGKMYGFDIIDGAFFANIRRMGVCPRCNGRASKTVCEICEGTGYAAVEPILHPYKPKQG